MCILFYYFIVSTGLFLLQLLLAPLVVCCGWVAGGVGGGLVALFLLSGLPSFCALFQPLPRRRLLVDDVL